MKRTCAYDSSQQLVYFDSLSMNDVVKIFQGFPEYLFACACVCKQWNQFFSAPAWWKSIPLEHEDVEICDASVWKQVEDLSNYGFSADEEPEVDKRKFFLTLLKLKRIFHTHKLSLEVKEKKFTLLTILKGFSCNRMERVRQEHKSLITLINFGWEGEVDENYAQRQVAKTYRVLVTNGILRGTRSHWKDFEAVIKKLDFISEARLPKNLEMSALFSATVLKNKKDAKIALNYNPIALFHDGCELWFSTFTFTKENSEQLKPGRAGVRAFERSDCFWTGANAEENWDHEEDDDDYVYKEYGVSFVIEM